FDRTATAFGYNPDPKVGVQQNPNRPPRGGPVQWPDLAKRVAPTPGQVPNDSEFRIPGQPNFLANGQPNPQVDWRSFDAALAKVDLHRFLTPYPHQGSGFAPTTATSTPITTDSAGNPDPNGRFDVDL